MQQYYGKNCQEIVGLLGSNINKGLFEYDCTLRREAQGDNTINIGYSRGKVEIAKGLFKKKYIYISLFITLVFLLKGLSILAFINFLLLIFNVGFKVYYEIKKEKELDILQNLNKSKVTVLREGVERLVEAKELVKGDIVLVKKHSFIGADLRIIKSSGLKVDERSITGEDFIKEKYENKIHGQASELGEINNMLFRGSFIKEGSGLAIVVETGNNTELGKLLAMINRNNDRKYTILRKIEDISLKVILCLILVELIIYLILPGSGINKQEIFMYGLFAIVNVCMPLIVLLYSKAIKKSMLEDGVDIVNFSALDLVKDVNVIFLNKFENITKNELHFQKIYTNEKILKDKQIDIKDINVRRILDISLLVNDAKYNNDNNWIKGDMYEIAYIKYCVERRIFKAAVDNKNKRKFEVPKDTNKKVVTTVNKCEKGYRANVRGTIDGVLEFCTHILVNGIERPLAAQDIEKIKLADLGFSRESLLTEAFAYRSFAYEPSKLENVESNLVFVGLVALENLFVEGVTEEIENLMDKGILPIILTDDNKIVGEMIGRKLGLISGASEVISGVELSTLSDIELYKVISRTRVFCRLTPELKIKIISIFNSDNFKVCVEGETLGDLSVVNSAYLSIVKGKSSTLLKQCSDVHINENSLKAFLKIIKKGKVVEDNIENGVKVYSILALAQIVALNAYYIFSDKRLFSIYTIVFMNFLLLTPVALIVMNYGKKELNKNKFLIRCGLFFLIPAVSIIFISEFNEFVTYMVLGGMLISYGIVNSNLSFRTFNIGVKSLIVAMIVYILGGCLIGIMSSIVYSRNLIFMISISILIYLISDIIITKWQDS